MSRTKWIAVGVLLVLAGAWSADAQQPMVDAGLGLGSRQLVTHFEAQTNGPTVLTVVEPQTHVVAVYHVSRGDGKIKLMSVRNFDLDLRMGDYNNDGLSVKQIREMINLQQQ
jgi:hypothetical protein